MTAFDVYELMRRAMPTVAIFAGFMLLKRRVEASEVATRLMMERLVDAIRGLSSASTQEAREPEPALEEPKAPLPRAYVIETRPGDVQGR